VKRHDLGCREEAQRRQERKGWTIARRAGADRISLH
jgi:hypothetical protein